MTSRRWALPLALLAISGCGDAPSDEAPPTPTVASTSPPPAPSPSPSQIGPLEAPLLVPEAEKGSKGAVNVMLTWARAMERKDFATAFAQMDDGTEPPGGMDSGELERSYAEYRTITIGFTDGTMEGAAGSSYYTIPTTVSGERVDGRPYRLDGQVVLKRVNDVPGATPEQLRWHIIETNLTPALP